MTPELWRSRIGDWLEAAGRGDTAVVADFLQSGIDVDIGNSIGHTALMEAVRGCQIDSIRVLLDHGASLIPENGLGFTAMTYAVIGSRYWEHLANFPQPDPRPLELLVAAGGTYRLCEAVWMNDLGLARARLDEGADVNMGRGTYHGPLLKIAAEYGHLEIVDLLLDRGAEIEEVDDLGGGALVSAARAGRTEIVRRLLDRGADIDATDWSEQSALSNAAVGGHHELVDLLMSRGARRGIVDALVLNDQSIFEVLLEEKSREECDIDSHFGDHVRLAMLATRLGNVAAVRRLLDRGAVHLHWYDDHPLLAEASRYGHVEVVRLLIDRGADLHTVGKDGLTPLAWAVKAGQDEIARLLGLESAVEPG